MSAGYELIAARNKSIELEEEIVSLEEDNKALRVALSKFEEGHFGSWALTTISIAIGILLAVAGSWVHTAITVSFAKQDVVKHIQHQAVVLTDYANLSAKLMCKKITLADDDLDYTLFRADCNTPNVESITTTCKCIYRNARYEVQTHVITVFRSDVPQWLAAYKDRYGK